MIHVVTGPPCAGKSSWVRERAVPGIDVVIDFDVLAVALGADDTRTYPRKIAAVVRSARSAVVEHVLRNTSWQDLADGDAYIVHTKPSALQRRKYRDANAEIHELDPGKDVVLQRIRDERPSHLLKIAESWYRDQADRAQSRVPSVPTVKPKSSRSW